MAKLAVDGMNHHLQHRRRSCKHSRLYIPQWWSVIYLLDRFCRKCSIPYSHIVNRAQYSPCPDGLTQSPSHIQLKRRLLNGVLIHNLAVDVNRHLVIQNCCRDEGPLIQGQILIAFASNSEPLAVANRP